MAFSGSNQNKQTTFSYSLSTQIHCFALNNSGNRVIVAGKGGNSYDPVWELLNIDDKFTSVNILNLTKRKYNLRIMDICWSRIDENTIASCGSNGELQKITLAPTELKIDSFKLHDRTINKIHFHPYEPNILISGGQDGYIKLIDFRTKNDIVSIFHQHPEEKVTDLQFNPSSSMTYQFVSGSENGCVYLWDTRSTKYERRHNAHLGVVHLDWHPEERHWLATATSSVDRQICVLDLASEKFNTIYSITNSDSVSSIKWRPKRKMQIAACLAGFDPHLYVWDLTRPYVPYASFDSVSKVQNFMWRNGPKCLIAFTRTPNSCSKLYNTYIHEALKPADHATLVTVEMDNYGSIAFAVGVGDKSKTITKKTESIDTDNSSTCSDYENEKFQITQSVLYFDNDNPLARTDWFYYSATRYKFNNSSFEDLCDHNAQIAYSYKKLDVYKNWMILKTLYKEIDKYEIKEENNSKTSSNASNSKQQTSNKQNSNDVNLTIQIPLSTFSQVATIANTSSSSNQSGNNSSSSPSELGSDESGMLGSNGNLLVSDTIGNLNNQKIIKDTSSNSDKISNYRQNENFYTNTTNELNTNNIEDEVNNSHIKFDDDDYSILPNDIIEFNNMEDLVDFFNSNDKDNYSLSNEQESNQHYHHPLVQQNNSTKNQMNMASNYQMPDFNWILNNPGKNAPNNVNEINTTDDKYPPKGNQSSNTNEVKNFNKNNASNNNNDIDQNKISDLNSYFTNQLGFDEFSKMNFDEYFRDLLLHYINEENDLTTAIFMYLVATLNDKFDKSKIDIVYIDEWFSQYIELLAKFELWNLRTEIVKAYQSDAIKNLTQKSLIYNVMCAMCKKTIKQNTFVCISCKKNVFLCSYCHLPVRRLYAWCHNCCHGGHLIHMMKWFKKNAKCPTGCGCTCSPNYNLLQNSTQQ